MKNIRFETTIKKYVFVSMTKTKVFYKSVPKFKTANISPKTAAGFKPIHVNKKG